MAASYLLVYETLSDSEGLNKGCETVGGLYQDFYVLVALCTLKGAGYVVRVEFENWQAARVFLSDHDCCSDKGPMTYVQFDCDHGRSFAQTSLIWLTPLENSAIAFLANKLYVESVIRFRVRISYSHLHAE